MIEPNIINNKLYTKRQSAVLALLTENQEIADFRDLNQFCFKT